MKVGDLSPKLIDFFWKRVTPSPGEACWEWRTGNGTRPARYGNISLYGGREAGIKCISAHRASWIIHHGDIDDKLLVCHKCDNPACVRPDHLYLGTQSENIRDCIAKGRFTQLRVHLPDMALKTHCPSGHAYDPANTGVSTRPNGGKNRYCRTCQREWARIRRRRKLCLA